MWKCDARRPWRSVRLDAMRMRAVLPFLAVRLNRPLAPVLLAQDATGPSSSTEAPFGSFALAAGFPDAASLRRISVTPHLRGRGQTKLELTLHDFSAG